MKGFKKDGKFRPTGKKSKSALKKADMKKVEYTDKKTGWTYVKIIKNKRDEQRWNKFVNDNKKGKLQRNKKSVDALGTPNDEVDHEERFNESDHDFVDYMSEGQIEDIANDYLYSLSKDMTQHDKLKALQGYLNGEFGSNPADEANLNSLASHLVFQDEQAQFEKEEHARYLEEEKFYKENNTSEEEEREKYFKEHPDEARQKDSFDADEWEKEKERRSHELELKFSITDLSSAIRSDSFDLKQLESKPSTAHYKKLRKELESNIKDNEQRYEATKKEMKELGID